MEAVQALQERNARVEADKAWEQSLFRRVLIMVMVYGVSAATLAVVGAPKPLLAALVPSVGTFLATLTLPAARRLWAGCRRR